MDRYIHQNYTIRRHILVQDPRNAFHLHMLPGTFELYTRRFHLVLKMKKYYVIYRFSIFINEITIVALPNENSFFNMKNPTINCHKRKNEEIFSLLGFWWTATQEVWHFLSLHCTSLFVSNGKQPKSPLKLSQCQHWSAEAKKIQVYIFYFCLSTFNTLLEECFWF